jgi:hypothetical protein
LPSFEIGFGVKFALKEKYRFKLMGYVMDHILEVFINLSILFGFSKLQKIFLIDFENIFSYSNAFNLQKTLTFHS